MCPLFQVKQKLSEDDMERLIDALEKMHHAEIQKHPEQWANLIGSPMMARYLYTDNSLLMLCVRLWVACCKR